MTDVKMLEKKINNSGLSHTAIAAALNVSMPTYYSRKTGRSEFTASEIVKVMKVLKLTKEERDAIFFGE